MKNLIMAPDYLSLKGENKKWKVFLAGPIQGAEEWQFTLPEIEDVLWLSPRRNDKVLNDFNHAEQVQWETDALRMANIVLFWIPKEKEVVSARSYAQTTRFELGENMARGKRIILGVNDEFPGRQYFEYKATKYKNVIGGCVHSTLEECVEALKSYIQDAKTNKTIYFTSDTHFSSDRALKLSRRPFSDIEDMDWAMIERWNSLVTPYDTVYHLGDFGSDCPLSYLTGKICFIEGNYERDKKDVICPEQRKVLDLYSETAFTLVVTDKECKKHSLLLGHEPSLVKRLCGVSGLETFGLFGHIHGRQKIKSFGMDVGVDCNNYTPVSLEEVLFYKNAVLRRFYDDEVWKIQE